MNQKHWKKYTKKNKKEETYHHRGSSAGGKIQEKKARNLVFPASLVGGEQREETYELVAKLALLRRAHGG